MLLEMIADHNDGSPGIKSRIHHFGCTNTSAYNQRDIYRILNRTNYINRNGRLSATSRLQINNFLTHQFCRNADINYGVYILWIERFCPCYPHCRSLHSAINQHICCRDEIGMRIMNRSRRLNLLSHKVFRVISRY